MKTYKIVYWKNGNKFVTTLEGADDDLQARYFFEMCVPNDDIISIEEVTENV